jgi:quercetin dioxygenase-like cupin family protein
MNDDARGRGDGGLIRIGQNEIELLLTGDDTGGAFSLSEYTMPTTGAGPPPHFHETTYEAFYVLRGTLRCTIDGETFLAEAGETVSIPPPSVHWFTAVGSEPAQFLLLVAPAGFEQFFVELGEYVATRPPGPVDVRRRRERAAELCERYDQTVVADGDWSTDRSTES